MIGVIKNMKYAMIPINSKYDENDNLVVRRVLISYKSFVKKDNQIIYKNTKLIDKDPYFSQKRSTTYVFEDSFYSLEDAEDAFMLAVVGNRKRRYHYNLSRDPLIPPAIEFEADSDEEAKDKFNNRNELRD